MKVLAALSGGVDSAVVAARAKDAGHDVVGVHMALSRNRDEFRTGSRGCCSIEDSNDARRAADRLGIPYYVWDLSDEFHDRVVTDFVAEYKAGRTPNPCVRCNEHIKFDTLLERADALGFDAVATGHYARIVIREDGTRELHRARDLAKDQSYVLAVMGPEKLARAMFPLGESESKQAVRNEAAARLLGVSNKPDSYDICFVADGDTKGFLERAPQAVAPIQEMFAATPLEGYLACGAAVRDMDHRELLPRIKAPTLVITGKYDGATTPEANEYISKHIPGAKFALLEAAHMSNVEQAEAYTDAVLGFLLDRGQ